PPQTKRSTRPQVSFSWVSHRRHQSNRNEETAAFSTDQIKPREILRPSSAGEPERIAPSKFRDIWRKVPSLQGNLRCGTAHTDGQRAMLSRFQWRRISFEFEPNKGEGKGGASRFAQANFGVRFPGSRVRGGHHQDEGGEAR